MKTKLLLIVCLFLGPSVSYAISPITAGPANEQEAFPQFNQDPRLGIIINSGTAHLNLFIYDEADRLLERVYLSGANSWLTINGQHIPRYWIKQLEVGRYRVEVYPFYYQNQLLVGRWREDLPKQITYLVVSRRPTDYYYRDNFLPGRHWGWMLYLNGGYIPDTAHGLPGVKINVWGNFDRNRYGYGGYSRSYYGHRGGARR